MRPATVLAFAALVAVLGGAIVFGLGAGGSTDSGDLVEAWISDTARDNRVNHHAVGAGPGGRVIVAPVAAVPNAEEITNSSCSIYRLDPDTGDVLWRASVDPEACFTHALTEPEIADADGDGDLEVLVATTENALVAYDASSGEEELRVPLSTYGYGRPTVGDLAPAPGPEVIAVDIGGGVVATGTNGTVLWRANLSAVVWATPVIDDVDGDGDPEALVGTSDGVVLLGPAGEVEWRAERRATTLAYGQADGDPAMEVFVTETRTVTALDGKGGEIEWSATFEGNPTVRDVGDADGDGRAEVYVGLTSQAVVAVDARTGEEDWRTRVVTGESATMPAPVLGDVDGDGTPEVIATANDGTVAVLSGGTGEELAAYEREVPIWTFATAADIDGDGDDEILVRYGDGRVVALDYR